MPFFIPSIGSRIPGKRGSGSNRERSRGTYTLEVASTSKLIKLFQLTATDGNRLEAKISARVVEILPQKQIRPDTVVQVNLAGRLLKTDPAVI